MKSAVGIRQNRNTNGGTRGAAAAASSSSSSSSSNLNHNAGTGALSGSGFVPALASAKSKAKAKAKTAAAARNGTKSKFASPQITTSNQMSLNLLNNFNLNTSNRLVSTSATLKQNNSEKLLVDNFKESDKLNHNDNDNHTDFSDVELDFNGVNLHKNQIWDN